MFLCLFQYLLIILCKHAYALRPAVIFCSLVARLDHGPLRFTWHYFIISMHMHVIKDHCLQALLLKWIPPQCQHCYASISSNLCCETIIFHCCNDFLWLLFDIIFFLLFDTVEIKWTLIKWTLNLEPWIIIVIIYVTLCVVNKSDLQSEKS